MTACIFVDGENFRHNVVDLFPEFRREDYLPRQANWTGFFDWVVEQASGADKRLRTYWYVIQSVDYSPYGLSRLERNPSLACQILSHHEPFKERLNRVERYARGAEASAIIAELLGRQAAFNRRFDGWKNIQDGIAARHEAIEFRRAGAIKYDLFTKKLGQEKAVDVKLAVDLVALSGSYDTAIILSGDQDYVPAVQMVKDLGKKAVNVAFLARNGKQHPGGSRRLGQQTDSSLIVGFDDLKEFLRI